MHNRSRIGVGVLTKLVAGAAMVCLMATCAGADDAAMVAMAQARAKADIAVRALEPMVDGVKSGWNQIQSKLTMVYNESLQILNNASAEENKKPAESRKQAFIDECTKRYNALAAKWLAFTGQESPVMAAKFTDAQNGYAALRTSMDQMATLELSLKNAKVEPAPLSAIYDAMEKRAIELQALSKQTVAEAQAVLKVWEAELNMAKGVAGQ